MNLRKKALILILTLPLIAEALNATNSAVWLGDPQYPAGSAWSVQLLSSDLSGSRMRLTCPGFWTQSVHQNGELRTRVILAETGTSTQFGLPELPSISRFLAIPDNRDAEVVIHSVDYRAFACESPYLSGEIQGRYTEDTPDTPAPEVEFAPDAIFPENWVESSDPVIFKDHRLAPVKIHPVRYDPITKELLLATNLEFEVKTTQASTCNVKSYHARTSEAFSPLYEALIDNLSEFNTAAPLSSEGARGAYLIFIADAYQNNVYLQDFITWKKQLGYQVTLMPLSTVGSTKEQIKEAITAQYYGGDVPLDYVLLIGDVPPGNLTIAAYTISKPGGSAEQDVTDHPYTLLEGQDYFPDVMIGRISVTSDIELSTALRKAVSYQREPYVSSPDWFKKALVSAGNYSDVGIAPITPAWTSLWLVDKLYEHGYTQVDTVIYWGPGDPSYPGTSEITASINGGVGLVAYRGWADANGWQYPIFSVSNVNQLENGCKMPVMVSIVCNTGDFGNSSVNPCFGEAWLRSGTPVTLRAGAAFYGPSDLHTNTKWNNALYAGFFEGLLEENLYRIGQAAVRSKLELYYGFPENTGAQDFVEFYFHVYNILGDPELSIWSDIPAALSLDAPSQIPPGKRVIEAVATNADGSPLGGAYVSFYKANEVLTGGVTDGNGAVSVEVEPASEGMITVTVSKQNRIPYQQEIAVQAGEFPLGISQLSVGGDGVASAGETFDLTITVKNYGSSSVDGVEATLAESDPYVTVNSPAQSLGSIAASSEVDGTYPVSLSPSVPNAHAVEFSLQLSDNAAHSDEVKFVLPVGGLQLLSAGMNLQSGSLEPGQMASFKLFLLNAGLIPAQGIVGSLTTSDPAVSILSNQSAFPILQPGSIGLSSSAYAVQVQSNAAVGRQVVFNLGISAPGGFTQQVSYPTQLGQPGTADPLGPDSYGYYAYDDTDAEYPEAPVFDWIELDPNYPGGSGATLHSMGDDVSETLLLPFTFTFYGVDYDTLTICSNGWVSLGETWMANFRNWNIPSALGPPALISPFWDDLKADTTGGSNAIHVYTRHDDAEGRYVVEWSRCINRFGYENYSTWKEETFELVLYDPLDHPTASGDGEILFQYLVVNDVDDNNNFATVGIEDEGHTRGLQYAYSADYPPSAAPLAANRAIKFTTNPPGAFGKDAGGSGNETMQLRFDPPRPNPANPETMLRFTLPHGGQVNMRLYNTMGQQVAVLLDSEMAAGEHRLEISGANLASGIYFAVLRFDGAALTQKILFLK